MNQFKIIKCQIYLLVGIIAFVFISSTLAGATLGGHDGLLNSEHLVGGLRGGDTLGGLLGDEPLTNLHITR